MDRPRAHSVMQMRAPTQSAFQVRASKLFQKVSAKFARAPPDSHSSNRDSSTNDANNMNSPYMRRGTYSMDGAVAKPYMSQPMLGLMLTRHVEDPDPDAGAEESDGSGSGSERGGVLGLPVGSVNMGMTLNSRRSDGNIVLHPAAPPRPSRAVPPPPPSNASSPPPSSNTTAPVLTIPPHPTLNLTPATPISPSDSTFPQSLSLFPSPLIPPPSSPPILSPTADSAPTAVQAVVLPNAAPPLRRARSQTLTEGRNWSRPSSVAFGESAQSQSPSTTDAPSHPTDTSANTGADNTIANSNNGAPSPTPSAISSAYATAPSTRPASVLSALSTASTVMPTSTSPPNINNSNAYPNPWDSHPHAHPPPPSSPHLPNPHPEISHPPNPNVAPSNFSSTSSYASAFSTFSTTSTIMPSSGSPTSTMTVTGLPVLSRKGGPVSGLPATREASGEWMYGNGNGATAQQGQASSPRAPSASSNANAHPASLYPASASISQDQYRQDLHRDAVDTSMGLSPLPPGAQPAADPHAHTYAYEGVYLPTSPPVASSPRSPSAASLSSSPPASASSTGSFASTSPGLGSGSGSGLGSGLRTPISPAPSSRSSPPASASSGSGSFSSLSSSLSPGGPDPRRASIVSFASGTSIDSWATAIVGESDGDGEEGAFEVDFEGGAELKLGLDGEERGRERADTLRAPTPTQRLTPDEEMIPRTASPVPLAAAEIEINAAVETPPPRTRSPPTRAATLPPIVTSPMPGPAAPAPVPPSSQSQYQSQSGSSSASGSSVATSTSTSTTTRARAPSHPTPSTSTPPWGPNGFAPGSASFSAFHPSSTAHHPSSTAAAAHQSTSAHHPPPSSSPSSFFPGADAGHPRARTASAGYSYTPSSPRLTSPSVSSPSPSTRFGAGRHASEFGASQSQSPSPAASTIAGTPTTPITGGTLPTRRRSSIAMSIGDRNSMSFNASGSHTPGGSLIFNPAFSPNVSGNNAIAEAAAAGRLSPSIIIPVWAGRLPAFPALPLLSPTVSGSASVGNGNASGNASGSGSGGGSGSGSGEVGSPVSGSVGRRSSVIFGPGAHGREASRSVVRSMPALAMEGAGVEPGVAAGESDEEDGDLDIEEGDDNQAMDGERDEGDVDAEDGNRDDESRTSRGTDSPFVPRLDIAGPLSLDIAGMLKLGGKGKGKGKERERAATVGAETPLRPQASQGSGKTPTVHAWHAHDYFSLRTPTSEGTPRPGSGSQPMPMLSPTVRTVPMPPLPAPERPGMYKHASRSMVDILPTSISVEPPDVVEEGAEDGHDNGKGKGKTREPTEAAPAYEGPPQRAGTVKRRRSMPEIMAAPPPYTMPLFPSPFFNLNTTGGGNAHPLAQARIVPREDEGREVLPRYTNDILLRGVMPRKMEFSAPGVQARDRKWRRVVCELEGTVFRVYRCAGEGWWEKRVGAGDVAVAGGAVTSAAAVVKAKATAAAARQGQEVNKIAGEGGRVAGVEGGEDDGTTEVAIPPRSSMSSARSRASSAATPPSPSSSPTESNGHAPSMASSASRSRLNLGLSLLKPRSHGRSKSDLPNPPKSPNAPRSSLSIPRPSFGGSSSSGASSSGGASSTMVGSPLAPSRSNVSLVSSSARSGVLSAHAPVTSSSSSKGKGKSVSPNAGTAGTDLPEPDPADLIRAYTLQNAESGLGNDYLKRKHVIRVRLEGEQFLLQARDVGDVVDWIEGLHSATNIALDLDERIMPKGPLFPRRRRRRQRPANGASEPTTNTDPPPASLAAR